MKKFFIKISALIAIAFTLIAGALITLKFSGREVNAQEYSSGTVALNNLSVGDVIKRGTTVTGPSSVWTVQIDNDYRQIDPTDSYCPDSFVADRRYTVIWNYTAGNPKTLYLTKHVGVEKEVAVDTEWYFGDTFVLNGATWLKVGEDGTLQPKANIGAGKYVVPWPASNSGKWYCFQNMFGGNSFNVIDNRTGYGASGGFKCTGGDGTEDNPYTFELINKPDFSDEAVADEDAAAIVGDKNYATLKDAVAACPEDGTVKLLADIDLSSEVTMEGDGSQENPYLIRTETHLRQFADMVENSGPYDNYGKSNICGKLIADIDTVGSMMNPTNWDPIGSADHPYNGTFDGNGHEVRIRVYLTDNTQCGGFFAILYDDAVVKNLTVSGMVAVDAESAVGGIAGICMGQVINCVNKASIEASGYYAKNAGGIVGECYYNATVLISRCVNAGTVDAPTIAGGIVGYMTIGTVTDCYNVGIVRTMHDTEDRCGGIVGYLNGGNVMNCFSYGRNASAYPYTITNVDSVGVIAKTAMYGGVIGNVSDSYQGTISHNYYLKDSVGTRAGYGGDFVVKNGGFNTEDVENKAEMLTAEQFKAVASFVDWDFNGVWMMGENHPVLAPEHKHNLIYEADPETATITAICNAEGCPVENHTATLTISAPSNLLYNAKPKTCTLNKNYNTDFFPNPAITYYDSDQQEVQSAVEVGTYTAKLQQGDTFVTIEFTIEENPNFIYAIKLTLDMIPDNDELFSITDYPNFKEIDKELAKTWDCLESTGTCGLVYKANNDHIQFVDGAYDQDLSMNSNNTNKTIRWIMEQYGFIYYYTAYKKGEEGYTHVHNLTYTANGDTITATCSESDCPNPTGTLKLLAPTTTEVDKGSQLTISFEEGYDETLFRKIAVKYYLNDALVEKANKVGHYVAKVTFGTATAEVEFDITTVNHTHDNVAFTPWALTNSLPTTAGNYYLTADVTISSTWTVPSGTTNLCLNGFGIKKTGSGSVINIESGKTLAIYDCEETVHYFDYSTSTKYAQNINETPGNGRLSFKGGYITGGKDASAIKVQGTFVLNAGNIIGNVFNAGQQGVGNKGAGVYVYNGGTFEMHGGSISYNFAQNCGGAVQLLHGTMYMTDGEISHNMTDHAGGSAIAVHYTNADTPDIETYAYISGGVIEYNYTKNTYGAVDVNTGLKDHLIIEGSPVIRNNWNVDSSDTTERNISIRADYSTPAKIDISGALDKEASFGVRIHGNGGLGVFTTGWNDNMSDKSASDYIVTEAANRFLGLKDGELVILDAQPVVAVNGNSYTTLLAAYEAAQENDVIVLLVDIDLTQVNSNPYLEVKKNIGLDLNGYILKFNYTATSSQITLSGNKVITIDNSRPETGGILGAVGVAKDGSYLLIMNARLAFTLEQIEETSVINQIASGYAAMNINKDGTPDTNGFITIVSKAPYEALDKDKEIIIKDGDKEKADSGDTLTVDTTATPIEVEWFYDDDHDNQPDDEFDPIGRGEEYTVRPQDEGHTIIVVIKQREKEDGTDYPEVDIPTVISKPFTVNGEIGPFFEVDGETFDEFKDAYNNTKEGDTVILLKDLDMTSFGWSYVNITHDLKLDLKGHKLYGRPAIGIASGITLSIDNSTPETGGIAGGISYNTGIIKLFNARMDVSADEINIHYTERFSTAKGYEAVQLGDGNNPDENGYYAIVQPKVGGGTDAYEGGKTYTLASAWYLDDMNKFYGTPEEIPAGEYLLDNNGYTKQMYYTFVFHNEDYSVKYFINIESPELAQEPNAFIITGGTGTETDPYTMGLVLPYVALDTTKDLVVEVPDGKENPSDGDKLKVTVEGTDLTIEWYYDDNKDGIPDKPSQPLPKGKNDKDNEYTVRFVDLYNLQHSDYEHNIIAVVKQNTDENGYEYNDKPTVISNTVAVSEFIPETKQIYVGEVFLLGEYVLLLRNAYIKLDSRRDNVEIAVGGYRVPDKWNISGDLSVYGLIDMFKTTAGTIESLSVPYIDGDYIGIMCVSGTGTNGDPYVFEAILADSYIPLNTNREIKIETPRGNDIVREGDELTVHTPATPVVIEWFYTDTDGKPKGEPIGTDETYTIKPEDKGNNIVAVITQPKKSDGTDYPEGEVPTVTTEAVKFDDIKTTLQVGSVYYYGDYIVLNDAANIKCSEISPDKSIPAGEYLLGKPTFSGDNAHFANLFGEVRLSVGITHKPLVTSKILGVKCVGGTGVAGDPYIFALVYDYKLDSTQEIIITVPEDKEEVEDDDELTVDVNADPVTIEWYYDDDNDGNPDDPRNPIGTGKTYIVKCPDEKDPTHDDTGHTIIAVVKQDKRPDGTGLPNEEVVTKTTPGVKVKEPKEIKKGEDFFKDDLISFEDNKYVYVYYVNGKEKVSAEIKAGTYKVTLNVTKQDEPLSYVFAALFKDSKDKDVDLTTISFSGTYVPADEIVGLRCVGGKGTKELPYILVATIKTDYYVPLNPDDVIPVIITGEEPLEGGDTIEVESNATEITVEWFYDDNEDGIPDDPKHPIDSGMTYTVKTPDDTGHSIIGVIKQTKDEDGNDYPEDKTPTAYTDPIRVKGNVPGYEPLDPNGEKPVIKGPTDKDEPENGDVLEIEVGGFPVVIEWYYDDDGDGLPDGDNPTPIGIGKEYTVKTPEDEGHTIIGVITQPKKPDGTDYPDEEVPTIISKPIKVKGNIPGYQPLDDDPTEKPVIKGPTDKDEPENGDVLEIETTGFPVVIEWYYDDDGDGFPDKPGQPIGTGKEYTVKTPEDEGHTIIGVITQTKEKDGTDIPEDERPVQITKPIKVKGNIPGYQPLDDDPTEKPVIKGPTDKDEPENGDVLEIETTGFPVVIEWYYDDDGDGFPDKPGQPIGTGKEYTVKTPEDEGHTIIGVITQTKEKDGTDIPEDERPVQITKPIKVKGDIPGYEPLNPDPVEQPVIKGPTDKDEPENGDVLEIETTGFPVVIEWYYDDDGDGFPDNPEKPIGKGYKYEVKTPEDEGHTIIGVITQTKEEDGTDIPEDERPVQITKPIKVKGNIPGYEPLEDNPSEKPVIEIEGEKEVLEVWNEISVDVDSFPVVIKWYYDDDGDGNPDDPEHPLGTGKTYTPKCPEHGEEGQDDRGHKIIAVITQPKKIDGSLYPEGEVPTQVSEPVTVATIHTHEFAYIAVGDSIIASCKTGCPITEGLTLTLVAPEDLEYDGGSKTATLAPGYSKVAFPTPFIRYYLNGKEVLSAIEIGTYVAKITFDGSTAEVTFEIVKGTPYVNAPKGITVDGGSKLSDVALPEGFRWANPDQVINKAGEQTVKVIYTPKDTKNYNEVEIEIKIEGKWDIKDETQEGVKVDIKNEDGVEIDGKVSVKVEVKTDVKASAEAQDYADIEKSKVEDGDEITFVYSVKLIRTVTKDGQEVQEEIQPSDIKEGTVIVITMNIPEELKGKDFKVLHIHNNKETSYVEYKISKDGNSIIVEVTQLSEFAFVSAKAPSHGFCIGYVVLIFVILALLCLPVYIILYFGLCKSLVAKLKLDKLNDKLDLIGLICLCVTGAIFVFALVALIVHQCAATIVSFILAFLICGAFLCLFLLKKLRKNEENPKPNKPEKVEEKEEKAEVEETPLVEESETKDEPVDEVESESNEETVPAEEASDDDSEVIDTHFEVMENVKADEVDEIMSDEVANALIVDERKEKATGKKGIVNVDKLTDAFNDGDTVTIDALKEKGLVANDVKQVKLLAYGSLNKKLNVELQDYSIEAAKMVILAGGTVKRV